MERRRGNHPGVRGAEGSRSAVPCLERSYRTGGREQGPRAIAVGNCAICPIWKHHSSPGLVRHNASGVRCRLQSSHSAVLADVLSKKPHLEGKQSVRDRDCDYCYRFCGKHQVGSYPSAITELAVCIALWYIILRLPKSITKASVVRRLLAAAGDLL